VPAWALPPFSNRLLVGGALVELAIAATLLWTPALAVLLRHAAPAAVGWSVAIASGGGIVVADAAWKAFRRRRSPAA
jgi:hypothetical protein